MALEILSTFVFCFILIYILYLIFVVSRKKKQNNILNTTEVIFLKKKYNLKLTKINKKKLANEIAICNSFIISSTVSCVVPINKMIFQFLAGFVILVGLILIIYSFLGKEYKRKEEK